MRRAQTYEALAVSTLAVGAVYLLLPVASALLGQLPATRLAFLGVMAAYAVALHDRRGLSRRRALTPLAAAAAIALLIPAATLPALLATLAFVRNRRQLPSREPPRPASHILLREAGLLGTGLLVAAALHTGTRESLCFALYAFLLVQLLGETLIGLHPIAAPADGDPFTRAQRRLQTRLRGLDH